MSSFELLSTDSRIRIGSLGTSFGVGGASKEVSTLGGTDVMKATKRGPPDTSTKAKEGVGARLEGRADDT